MDHLITSIDKHLLLSYDNDAISVIIVLILGLYVFVVWATIQHKHYHVTIILFIIVSVVCIIISYSNLKPHSAVLKISVALGCAQLLGLFLLFTWMIASSEDTMD